jgi:23S rRNA (uracil1939-C5)-methyltransferase
VAAPRFLDVEIEFLNAAGDGVGRAGRRQLIVPFTIPGERVRVRPGPSRDDVSRGALDAVLRPSPHRVSARCVHFGPEANGGPCGGCSWQHIAYPEQLRLKTALVTRLVRAAVPGAPEAQPMLAGTPLEDPWGYRHKVHFVFGTDSRGPRSESARRSGPTSRRWSVASRGAATSGRQAGLAMGHYARGSRRVIEVRECPVHDERGNTLAFRLRDEYVRARAAAAPAGTLRSIAVRVAVAARELMAILVVTNGADRAVREATRRVLSSVGDVTSFHLNVHPKADAFIFGPTTRTVAGSDRLREEVAGVSFLISPTAFFQTNVHAAEILVQLARQAIPAGARVLDLYAGAGLFALPLAGAGHEVVAVEENRAAVADGESSRRFNRIPEQRCRFVAGRVEQTLSDIVRSVSPTSRFDAVVLDPPREGCSPAVIDRLFGTLAPASAVYVSCNPEALARDLAAITRLRYRINSIQPIDMFPHTAHVEAVVVLTR